MACGIYKFENNINHMIYIGQAIDLENRYNKHIRNIRDKKHQEDFYLALREYGIENFSYEILESFESYDRETLNSLECYYIDFYNSMKPNGYNMVPGGSNGAGLAMGKKIQQFDMYGQFIAEYPSALQAAYSTGIEHSSICACARGQNLHTKTFQWKYNDSNKIITDISAQIKLSHTPIWQYDLQGNFIQEFSSYKDALDSIDVASSSLCNCLKGKYNSCGGFLWSYANQPIKKKPKISQLNKNGEIIAIFSSALEAKAKTGISNTSIGKVCNGKAKSAGGYYWKFI